MCGTKVNEYGMVNMFVIIQKAMDGHSTVSLIEDILENIQSGEYESYGCELLEGCEILSGYYQNGFCQHRSISFLLVIP